MWTQINLIFGKSLSICLDFLRSNKNWFLAETIYVLANVMWCVMYLTLPFSNIFLQKFDVFACVAKFKLLRIDFGGDSL